MSKVLTLIAIVLLANALGSICVYLGKLLLARLIILGG